MKKANLEINKIVKNIPKNYNGNKTLNNKFEISAQTAQLVNQIFSELQGIFPAWRAALPTDEAVMHAKKQWIKGFAENGINSISQLERGFKQARKSTSPFLPCLGQFIKWCKVQPTEIGLPEAQEAYVQACHVYHAGVRAISHPVVYLAAQDVGVYDLMIKPEGSMLPKFKVAYEKYIEKVIAGEDFSNKLPKPKKTLKIAQSVLGEKHNKKNGLAILKEFKEKYNISYSQPIKC